jgi:hypothetical protein
VTRVVILLGLVVLAAGCGSNDDEPSAAAESPVEKCATRVLERAQGSDTADVKRYARSTCQQFHKRGLVHEDGTLKIAVVESGSSKSKDSAPMCAAPTPGEPTRSCPDTPSILDCGLLDLVRRAEVQAYLDERRRQGPVQCDDGRSVDELGSD